MPNTIPASFFVTVNPSILSAGGTGVVLNGLMLTNSTRVPIGQVAAFPNAAAVGAYFGLSSNEYAQALVYFQGFNNSNVKPGSLLFSQYPLTPVAAYLQGGRSTLALADIQAIKPASVTGSIGGVTTGAAGASFTGTGTGTTLAISALTGYVSVGDVVSGAGVPAGTFIVSQSSGSAGGTGNYVTNQATTAVAASLTTTSTIANVTAVASGSLQVGDVLSGTGVTAGTTVVAQLSGTPGSTGLYRVSAAQRFTSTTVTSLSTTLNVTAVGSGALVAGMKVTGTSVTAGSRIASQLTGSAGSTGLYSVSAASTTISETITGAYDFTVTVDGTPATASSIDLSAATSFSAAATTIGSSIGQTVTYDSVSGAFIVTSPTTGATSTMGFGTGGLATALNMTAALGAFTSQGANATTPAAAMAGVIAITTNWGAFTTLFNPDNSGNANKLAFAAWTSTQNDEFAYVAWDTDVTPTTTNNASNSLGALVKTNAYSGTIVVWEPSDLYYAAFIMGAIASIDFNETQGRASLAYKGQSGLVPSVTSAVVAQNLEANGYNYYGISANASEQWNFLFPGSVSGPFEWIDSYVNQIWMNAAFQADLMTLLTQLKSIPYNAAGYAMIEAACRNTIDTALNFGAIQPGVTLSALQAAEVNAAAGVQIATTLQNRGWYFQVKDASPSVRASRGSPPCTFWYTDGGSINRINLASVNVQ